MWFLIADRQQFTVIGLSEHTLPQAHTLRWTFNALQGRSSVYGRRGENWLHSDTVDLYEVPECTSVHVTRPPKRGGCIIMCT